jgi:hypothetical protein
MVIIFWIAFVLFIGLALNAGLIIRYRIFIGNWPTFKVLIISNTILVIFFLLYFILPKSDGNCTVNIIINNKNSISEIIINKEYIYHLNNNEKIVLENIESYGTIAIKTENNAMIIGYFDDNHLFKLKHKINILIVNNKIDIRTFPKLSVGKITDNIQIYDRIIYLYKKNIE